MLPASRLFERLPWQRDRLLNSIGWRRSRPGGVEAETASPYSCLANSTAFESAIVPKRAAPEASATFKIGSLATC